jgi:membrane protease YdiL (CAAX protease family)
VFTSAIFGFAHGQWNVGVDTFALSLALCYLAYKTNSLWPSVLLHSLKNLIAFILVFVITPEQLQLLWQRFM